MKNLKELKGVKLLSKKEQQAVNGGKKMCFWSDEYQIEYCPRPYIACIEGICVLTMP